MTTTTGLTNTQAATTRAITYLRVSTSKQGQSGLGIEAQRKAVSDYMAKGNYDLLGEYVEIESGRKNDRPELAKALSRCRLTGATLIVAKLDRLSRNAPFLLSLQESCVKLIFVDMPTASELTIGIMALVAQEECKAISTRTKAALSAAKERGVKLGCPNGAKHLRQYGNSYAVEAVKSGAENRAASLKDTIAEIRACGFTTLRAIANELNRLGINTARGGKWHPTTVKNLLARMRGDLD